MTLAVAGLTIGYRSRAGWADAVRDLTLALAPGETYGLVGESGSGKSTLAYALMGALGEGGAIRAGALRLPAAPEGGAPVAMVHQEPLSALDPVMTVGAQLVEAVEAWRRPGRAAARAEALAVMERVGLPDPAGLLRSYPHELSGGQAQRVVIAMALLARPALMVLDEPTTGLDATVERQVVDLIAGLGRERGMAMLYISHNLGLIARVADRIGVLYAGDLVEEGPAAAVLGTPRHPYTRALIGCLPRLDTGAGQARLVAIPGTVPRPEARPPGCAFAPRCSFAMPGLCDRGGVPPVSDAGRAGTGEGHRVRCLRLDAVPQGPSRPEVRSRSASDTATGGPLLRVTAVGKTYGGRGLFARRALRALDSVSFDVRAGETVALVGESGSGKSTLARILIGLETADAGTAMLGEIELARLPAARRTRALIRRVQIVFQNPDATLNPAHTVRRTLARALRRLGVPRAAVPARIAALLDQVRLGPELADRRPDALSGGQRQRVAIARALAGSPDLIVADEPVSALDVSVQAAVLALLEDIRDGQGTAMLFISHDLAVVRHLASRVVVLLRGRVMEAGPADAVFGQPLHPYTRMLLAAHHPPDPGFVPPPLPPVPDRPPPPRGCPFEPACPIRIDRLCAAVPPPERRLGDRRSLCHHPIEGAPP